jgi:hypothetical protein
MSKVKPQRLMRGLGLLICTRNREREFRLMIQGYAKLKGVALSALLLGGGLFVGTAFGHTPADPAAVKNLNRLSAAANVVARTRVTNVQFKVSAPGNGSPGIPYTFVTFAIQSTLQGSAPASLTLRFVGGTDGRGGFVGVEGVPAFEVGDQDILFIANNGMASGCPLVMCEFGRFRVSGNQVYATHGEPVLSVTNGQIKVGTGFGPDEFQSVRYPAPSFDDLMKNPAFAASMPSGISVDAARALYAAQAPKTIEVRQGGSVGIEGPMNPNAPAVAGLSTQSFLSAVSGATSAAARVSQPLQSASMNAPFREPAMVAGAPAAAPPGPAPSPGPTIRKN